MKKTNYLLLTKTLGFYVNVLSYLNSKKALALAYQFFSEPRKGRLNKEELPELLEQSQMENHQNGNDKYQTYTWKGNKDVVFLIHGWESNTSRWEKLLPYLKKTGLTIIAIDAPAHGLSNGKEFNVPKYAEFINSQAKIHKPKHIIAHSLGGVASAYYQNNYNNTTLEKMILLGSPSDLKIIIDNFVQLLSLNSRVHQSLISYTKKRFNIDVAEFSTSNLLKNSPIKGIIAHDTSDKIVAYSEAQKVLSTWKNATLITTQGLGHSLHDDELYEQVATFLLEG
jgi:predicted alpha/beta hydrolase family esterase